MTDTEINEAVAKKLWGDEVCHYPGHISNECCKKSGLCSWPPNYCHSIEAAWEIVETRQEVSIVNQDGFSNKYGFYLHNNGENWEAGWLQFSDGEWMSGAKIKADTAPKAICLAFLKLDAQPI